MEVLINDKSQLQQICLKNGLGLPIYDTEGIDTRFKSRVQIVSLDIDVRGTELFVSKREAERDVAKKAIELVLKKLETHHKPEEESRATSEAPKHILHVYCQKTKKPFPVYEVDLRSPPGLFVITVQFEGQTFKSPPRSTKREAEQEAAREVLEKFNIVQELSKSSDDSNKLSPLSWLNHYCQKNGLHMPSFIVERHLPMEPVLFDASVVFNGQTIKSDPCKSKREAEHDAAKRIKLLVESGNQVTGVKEEPKAPQNVPQKQQDAQGKQKPMQVLPFLDSLEPPTTNITTNTVPGEEIIYKPAVSPAVSSSPTIPGNTEAQKTALRRLEEVYEMVYISEADYLQRKEDILAGKMQ